MSQKPMPSLLPVFGLLLLLVASGCGSDAPPPEAPPRPVVTLAIETLEPDPPLEVTGVAEPYREAEVSFEVSGRITSILDVGRNVEVTTTEKEDAKGSMSPDALTSIGEVIAQIDDTSYRQRWEAATHKLRSAEEGLKAQELDLEEVAPKTVARAQAQRDAAESEIASARASVQSAQSNETTTKADLDRNSKLYETRQISKSEFDQYKNAYDNAVANLAKARAGLTAAQQQLGAYEATLAEAEALLQFKAASFEQAKAQRDEMKVAVDQALTDLERCTLRAPFVGRITEVYASQGDFVSAGKPVLRLTLIDPIKVLVTVSADREREILPGSHVEIEPRGVEDFDEKYARLFGTVFEKGAVADAATRTFRIEVMVRNARRRRVDTDAGDVSKLRFRELLPAVERNHGEGGPLYVCMNCVVPEDGTYVIYRVKGGKFGQPRPPGLFLQRLELERVEVRPVRGVPDEFMQILNWSFRRVEAEPGHTLSYGDLLINFKDLDRKAVEKPLFLERFEWAIRPGDLVPVRFDLEPGLPGFWVPDDAIRAENETRTVFAVEGGQARAIPVTVHEFSGRLRRIEGDGLKDGLKLVVRGVHYVFDGARVFVSGETDLETYLGQGK